MKVKISRVLALFAVLGLVGVASGASLGVTDNMDSYSPISNLFGGPPIWFPSKGWSIGNGTLNQSLNVIAGTTPDGGNQGAVNTWPGTGSWGSASGINFDGVTTGHFQVGIDWRADGVKASIGIMGDGYGDTGGFDHVAQWMTWPGQTDQSWVVFQGPGVLEDLNLGAGTNIPANDWWRIWYDIDMDAASNGLTLYKQDIDDATGALTGSPIVLHSSDMPFTSFDFFEICAIGNEESTPNFDNFFSTAIPEPMTLSLLALGGVLVLFRRMR